MRSTIRWDYHGLTWSESFGATGIPVIETFGKILDHKTVGNGVNFSNHMWESYSLPGAAVQVSLAQVGASMRSEIAAKQVRVIAYPLLHGSGTIEFSLLNPGHRATPKNL
ncbi:MAG TPA: hypothetical protein VMU99_01275 [Acidimicrobiales bacterium]|nr:hypothetical protein [Acidimicrobiales bacterium]